MISVRVELGGPFRERFGHWHALTLGEGATIGDGLKRIGVNEDLYIVVVRNSERAELSDILKDGDTVVAFPPVGGG
ncbi:MAG: MoaD/ThiS family protein [Nitrososphaerota archaeon]|nr:MoaD/ThiS family protein [Nitrososphaerota archaeon]MDG6940120.1 MoaD/ThiS family protein [Nitrososphaerota archaeon]